MTKAQPSTVLDQLKRIGPGLIMACVVIGPGSILTSSKLGAEHGYGMLWIVPVALVFMLTYVTLGAKLGLVLRQSPGSLLTKEVGRWLAILIGLCVYFIASAFQFGNNLGVHSAFAPLLKDKPLWLSDVLLIGMNSLALLFLFAMKNVYKALERLMAVFVALMLIAFAANLIAARPHVGKLILGLIGLGLKPGTKLDISIVGLMGTTFVIAIAYYQAYLVQQKGWTEAQFKSGLLDSRVGSIILACLTLMIMSTAGTVLQLSKDQQLDLPAVAKQLSSLFGGLGTPIFCVGLFCAAYSSFIVNSMVGGFVLCDGLGLGSKPTERAPKLFTASVMIAGMVVALFTIHSGEKPLPAIVFGQAVTVLASPLLAIVILWLTNRRDLMGSHRNGFITNVLASLGLCVLLVMASYTAVAKVWPAIRPK